MSTVVQYGISYHFRTAPFEVAAEPPANSADVLLERRLYFENNHAALAFLRPFSRNLFATREFHSLLARLGFGQRFNEQQDEWMERLALSLVTGRVTVIESVPKAPATESVERPPERMKTTPPPRRAQPSPPPEQPEQSTFSADADEPAQVQTLVAAAQSGTPFCEACARAAAALASKNANNVQQLV